MTQNFFIFLSLMLILMTSCKTTKSPVSKKENIRNCDITLLAWNENTVHSYLFAITNDKKFYYTIIKNDSLKVEEYYQGKISTKSSVDTLFLDYHKNQKPYGVKNYLVTEVSGSYLIQPFDNSSKRIFLRKQKSGHRF